MISISSSQSSNVSEKTSSPILLQDSSQSAPQSSQSAPPPQNEEELTTLPMYQESSQSSSVTTQPPAHPIVRYRTMEVLCGSSSLSSDYMGGQQTKIVHIPIGTDESICENQQQQYERDFEKFMEMREETKKRKRAVENEQFQSLDIHEQLRQQKEYIHEQHELIMHQNLLIEQLEKQHYENLEMIEKCAHTFHQKFDLGFVSDVKVKMQKIVKKNIF